MTDLLRPIIGIENRTAQEVFDIMCDRFRSSSTASSVGADDLYRAQEIFESIGITASGCASAHGDPGGGLEMIAGYAEDGFRLLADRLAALAASSHPASAVDETLRNVLWQARDTIVQHHQWHAAQTDPDPEHGFIPADEYVDSSLYERTMAAIGAVDKLLETGPRDLEALSATPAQEVDETERMRIRALRAAEHFIVNGIEMGYIQMPEPSTPDSAHDTLPLIRAALAPEGDAR